MTTLFVKPSAKYENTKDAILDLIDRISFANEQSAELLLKEQMKRNILRYLNKLTKKNNPKLLEDELFAIHNLLHQFAAMQKDPTKPFQKYMTEQKIEDPEAKNMLNYYDNFYRHNFLSYVGFQIQTIFSKKDLQSTKPERAAIKVTLDSVANMHKDPEKYLAEPIAVIEKKPESKLKKYLTNGSMVIAGVLLVAMTIKIPLVPVAMFIIHVAMYCSLGIGLLGWAEKKYAASRFKAETKKHDTALEEFSFAKKSMHSFFAQRANPIHSDAQEISVVAKIAA